jgi:hypothetical protein
MHTGRRTKDCEVVDAILSATGTAVKRGWVLEMEVGDRRGMSRSIV